MGWPGLMLIEGDRRDCNAFWDRICRLCWQRSEIMGRETMTTTMSARQLMPFLLQELLGNKGTMLCLAALCCKRGRKDMFWTIVGLLQTPPRANNVDATRGHSVLVHVDHINDANGH